MDCLVKKPELLAPAGTPQALETVYDAGADAAYVGGKLLNMRMHRASYNFDEKQLAAAVTTAHQRGRLIYVTLNSLVFERELSLLREALAIIGQIRPDGIIVQDLAVAAAAREVCVHIPLHASTMMNIHSAQSACALALMGFVRVVTSRDIPLHEVRRIGEQSGLEMEYFIHGDMCIAHSSQCYGSALLFGQSANRGRCMKSCRWSWTLQPPQGVKDLNRAMTSGFLLARKDMCMIQHIGALMQNKIASLKIEGRMSTAEFLAPLVRTYRDAIDRYFADPFSSGMESAGFADLHERRVRNFSTSMALHNSGADGVDPTGSREPRFFSVARAETSVSVSPPRSAPPNHVPELAVHVGSAAAADAALDAGANAVYLGGDTFVGSAALPPLQWLSDFAARALRKRARVAVLATRIADERDLLEWRWLLQRVRRVGGLGVGVSTLGSLQIARDADFADILADFSLNICNSSAADELSTQGATRVTASVELEATNLAELLRACRVPVEVIVQGPLPAMVLEHCALAAATGHSPADVCPMNCTRGDFALRDTVGQTHALRFDRRCRNHLFMARDRCLLPHLAHLAAAGAAAVRVEAQFDDAKAVRALVSAYREALDSLSGCASIANPQTIAALEAAVGRGMGDGAYAFDDARSCVT